MLYSKLKKYSVKTPLGDKVGKIDDIIFNGETWKVEHIVISEGFLKKHRIGVRPRDVKIDMESEVLIVSPEVEHIEVGETYSSLQKIFASSLRRKDVKTADNEKAGHVYDLDIATELKNWEILKILIDTGWTQRRLRLGLKDIESMGDVIQIKYTREDIERLSRPELSDA